jgi:hypothetical protein
MKNSILFLICLSTSLSYGQDDLLGKYDSLAPSYGATTKLEKKFLWGFHYNLAWTDMAGVDSFATFTKPAVGAVVKVNYFPFPWLGFSLGAGHQMRGFGLITTDYYQALGERDSTYRCRMRTNNFELPFQVILRAPAFDFMPNGKFSLMLGVTPTTIFMAKRVFISVEDGFHDVTKIKSSYAPGFDFPLHAGLGVDMNAGNAALFRLHLFAEYGMKNMFYNPVLDHYSGRNTLFGLQISWLW